MNHKDIAAITGKPLRETGQLPPLTLAYIGDAVYELLARTALVDEHDAKPGALHRMSARRVRAQAQAAIAQALQPLLREDELEVFMRARNAQPHTLPKHATAAEYALATALEAVLGFVYLQGDERRLMELFAEVYRAWEGIQDPPKPKPYKG